jgi:hypothetical protein
MVAETDTPESPVLPVERSRRLKYLVLPERIILSLLNAPSDRRPYYTFPVIKGLPDGYRVEAVNYDYERAGFAIVVSHPSFPEVPLGVRVPDLGGPLGIDAMNVEIKWPVGVIA